MYRSGQANGGLAELSNDCNTVIAFYATSLASAVGPTYQPPNLVYLAKRWFDACSEAPVFWFQHMLIPFSRR
jgi:hypothetical protein